MGRRHSRISPLLEFSILEYAALAPAFEHPMSTVSGLPRYAKNREKEEKTLGDEKIQSRDFSVIGSARIANFRIVVWDFCPLPRLGLVKYLYGKKFGIDKAKKRSKKQKLKIKKKSDPLDEEPPRCARSLLGD